MIAILWFVSALCVAAVYNAPQTNECDQTNFHRHSSVWAVLIAGSRTWKRYRHQANVCHAYKLLRKNCVPENRIITFMYDDIAYNIENPEPGVIRNEPFGENVYGGVPIDYKGEDVNKDVYLKVLQGNKDSLRDTGSGRVVESTKKDNILIIHTGLGGQHGFVEFPDSGNDTLLYADELVTTFKSLHSQNAYKNILIYLESSHSAAMFDNTILPHNLNVMAMSAGGPDEDTWGTWCSDEFPCYAGLFSYAWMNHTEHACPHTSVFNHYDAVRNAVANTGIQHPQLYGDWSIGKLSLGDFFGYQRRSGSPKGPKIHMKHLSKSVTKNPYGNEFDKDSIIPNENMARKSVVSQKNDLQVKLENIFRLVLPNSYIRNEIFSLQPIIVGKINQHQCIYDLLSLFNKKCTRQDNNFEARQEDIDILALLCDDAVLSMQQMSAPEAIKKTCK